MARPQLWGCLDADPEQASLKKKGEADPLRTHQKYKAKRHVGELELDTVKIDLSKRVRAKGTVSRRPQALQTNKLQQMTNHIAVSGAV